MRLLLKLFSSSSLVMVFLWHAMQQNMMTHLNQIAITTTLKSYTMVFFLRKDGQIWRQYFCWWWTSFKSTNSDSLNIIFLLKFRKKQSHLHIIPYRKKWNVPLFQPTRLQWLTNLRNSSGQYAKLFCGVSMFSSTGRSPLCLPDSLPCSTTHAEWSLIESKEENNYFSCLLKILVLSFLFFNFFHTKLKVSCSTQGTFSPPSSSLNIALVVFLFLLHQPE